MRLGMFLVLPCVLLLASCTKATPTVHQTQPSGSSPTTTVLSMVALSQDTKDAPKALDKPVKAICFFTPADRDPVGIVIHATALLGGFQNYTSKLSIEVVDPDQYPDRASHYGVTEYQTVVFESDAGYRLVPPEDILVFDKAGNVIDVQGERSFVTVILEVIGKR